MDDMETYEGVLRVFAGYGFGKASMSEIASAANVSRQTLYNRFRTKKAVLSWAVAGFLEICMTRAMARLGEPETDAETALTGFFHAWISDVLPLLRASPHGAEILDLGADVQRRENVDRVARMADHLAGFMLARGICRERTDAEGRAFLLIMASKGLLLESMDVAAFDEGVRRAVRAVLLLAPAAAITDQGSLER